MVNATQENIGKSVYFLVVIIFVALVKPVLRKVSLIKNAS
jgi:hypothetical protein